MSLHAARQAHWNGVPSTYKPPVLPAVRRLRHTRHAANQKKKCMPGCMPERLKVVRGGFVHTRPTNLHCDSLAFVPRLVHLPTPGDRERHSQSARSAGTVPAGGGLGWRNISDSARHNLSIEPSFGHRAHCCVRRLRLQRLSTENYIDRGKGKRNVHVCGRYTVGTLRGNYKEPPGAIKRAHGRKGTDRASDASPDLEPVRGR